MKRLRLAYYWLIGDEVGVKWMRRELWKPLPFNVLISNIYRHEKITHFAFYHPRFSDFAKQVYQIIQQIGFNKLNYGKARSH